MDHDDQPPTENGEGRTYQTETFVVAGDDEPAFLATMQNLMDRIVREQQRQQQHPQPEQQAQAEHQQAPEHPQTDADMPAAEDPPAPAVPVDNESMPPLEPLANVGPPGSRPIRPLPRPHAHFHAHTPHGIVDMFTFNVTGATSPPVAFGIPTFTFNVGPDFLAGFETFILGGMQKDREPDPERAKVLLKGMEVVPEGLVRRLNRAGGIPGGQGSGDSEDSAGCAVCWGPLLDEVAPGEWDTAQEKEDKAKMAAEGKEHSKHDGDDFHGHIVALPCAHVYHAECLLPWFSRNTTCPTCRFDIDPESLTWMARPLPRGPPPPRPADDIPRENPIGGPPPPIGAQDAPNPQARQPPRAAAINAARISAFMNSFFRGTPTPHPQHHQPAPQNQPQAAPSQQQPQPQPQPQNLAGFQLVGPAAPHPPPPPNSVIAPLFRIPMPLFMQHAAPGGNAPNAPPPPPFQIPIPPPEGPIPQPAHEPIALHMNADFVPNVPPGRPSHPPPQRYERKRWTPPEPVGNTLRQRVEQKERELGLRCDDMVCGVAPSDEDPTPAALQSQSGTKRITIRAAYDGHGNECEHSFHPGCLVTSARVAGTTGEDEFQDEDEGVQVACPACRAVGSLTRAEWDEGAQASQAETV